jgi:hypothetical protein
MTQSESFVIFTGAMAVAVEERPAAALQGAP